LWPVRCALRWLWGVLGTMIAVALASQLGQRSADAS
jgi:hypothetical protein